MSEQSFTLFETPIGTCAIAWNARGLIGVQLPERDADATRARMRKRFPEAVELAPDGRAQKAIDGIVALLDGEKRDLSGIAIDDSATPEFNARVYKIVRQIPP